MCCWWPEVSNDGKTFAFKLRKGIKFSTGQEVGVKDVVASFQRIFKVSGDLHVIVRIGIGRCRKSSSRSAISTMRPRYITAMRSQR